MGYTPAQFFTVPFLILHRAFTDYFSDKTKMKEFILNEVFLMCINIIKMEKDSLKSLKEVIEDMTINALSTTQEKIPSIPLLLSQIFTLVKGKMHIINQNEIVGILRVLIDEADRRSLDQNLPQMTDKEICTQYLYPDIDQDIQSAIDEEIKSFVSKDVQDDLNTNLKIIKKRKRDLKTKDKEKMDLDKSEESRLSSERV